MKNYYFEIDGNCGIRIADSIEDAKSRIRNEVGTMHNIRNVHEASESELNWVKAMGGVII